MKLFFYLFFFIRKLLLCFPIHDELIEHTLHTSMKKSCKYITNFSVMEHMLLFSNSVLNLNDFYSIQKKSDFIYPWMSRLQAQLAKRKPFLGFFFNV